MTEDEKEKYRQHIGYELEGIEKHQGTHPFTLATALKAYRINDFLHRLIEPEHRERFLSDPKSLFEEFGLTEYEQTIIAERRWIEMIHYGVIFFLLEKLGAVIGVPNLNIYASMRGEDLETFQKSRNVSIQYSVAGGDKAAQIDQENN
jgi:gallate dioxygenase